MKWKKLVCLIFGYHMSPYKVDGGNQDVFITCKHCDKLIDNISVYFYCGEYGPIEE